MLEKLAKEIFEECEKDNEPITMADALEMAKMEIGAREIKRDASAKEKPKKDRKPKTVKVSDEKVELFDLLVEGLANYYENVEILKKNKLIFVQINDKKFKIDVIQTRK